MIDQLKSLAIFAEVVDAGSFRGAADRLDLSPSVVSTHVSSLEQEIGAALLYRSTRALSLTREGERLLTIAKDMVQAAEDGLNLFSSAATTRLIDLRVAIPITLSTHPVFQKIADFAKTRIGVRVNLVTSDMPLNLLKDGVDVAIRMGPFRDSELKSRAIGADRRTLVAAPAYIKQHSAAKHPTDLINWDFISFAPVPDVINLRKPNSKPHDIWGKTAAITDSVETMRHLAIAGVGVATIPFYTVKEDLKAKRLQQVLSNWADKELKITVVWPRNAALNSSTREFIDFMSA